ncbi:MAG: GntR family transcriptional regulator [Lachnospiraceae bacterium]|nr:GntR family transcriptional regulator [Lachnospiraceae bacterium]
MISFEDFILEDDSPIYMQIIRYVKRGIVSGAIQSGEEMISRRALSVLLGVNPNTIQKAYHLLEEEGIIRSRSGAKSCVEVDEAKKEEIRHSLLQLDTLSWLRAMKQMGVEREEALKLAEEMWQEA